MREDKDRSAMKLENEKLKLWKAAHEVKAEQTAPKAKSEVPLTQAQKLFQGQKSPKKRKKIQTLEQWVEIEVSPTGRTVTTQHPSNEILIQDGQKKWPAPEMVYRRMHFVHGVPHEYAWATSDERIRKSGGMGIQRMTVDTWLELIEKEKSARDGASAAVRGKFAETGRAGRVRLRGVFKESGDFGGAGGVEGTLLELLFGTDAADWRLQRRSSGAHLLPTGISCPRLRAIQMIR